MRTGRSSSCQDGPKTSPSILSTILSMSALFDRPSDAAGPAGVIDIYVSPNGKVIIKQFNTLRIEALLTL